MDAPQDPGTPESRNDPAVPMNPEATGVPRAPRRWRRDAIVAGVTAITVLGAAAVGAAVVRGPDGIAMRAAGQHAGPDGGAAMRADHGPQVRVLRARLAAGEAHGAQRAMRGAGAGRPDPAERAERLATLADELGIDVDALTTAVEALHEELDAERTALREELADLDVEARRAAMQAFAEERQARMRTLLIDLGADPAAVDAHLAEHAERAERGPRAGRHGGR